MRSNARERRADDEGRATEVARSSGELRKGDASPARCRRVR